MSLLNDMLRDLVQQRQLTEGVDAQDIRLLRGSNPGKTRFSRRLTIVVIFCLIFFNVLALRYAWSAFEKSSFTTGTLTAVDAQAKPAVNQVAMSPAATPIPDMPISIQNAEVAEPSAEAGAHIEDLFRQAERAVAMDRLTAPVEDNAYGYYQKILQLSPGNAEAEAGLATIAARYLAKAHEQLQLGNRSQADAFINRARYVAPDYVNAQPEMVSADVTLFDNQPQASTQTNTQANAQANTQGSTESPAIADMPVSETPVVESVKSLQVTETPSLAVKPNADWQDKQATRDASQLLEQGREAEAISLLKQALVSLTKPVASASLLVDIYLQQGETGAAEVLLNQLDYLPPLSRTKIKAQLAVIQGDQPAAINLLEQQLSDAQGDENYRALLASLYHKTGNYTQSVLSYQRLIASFGEKPAYWLGMALAYDGLGQPKNALQAYVHLREFAQLQDQVKTYTDQRIAALRSQ